MKTPIVSKLLLLALAFVASASIAMAAFTPIIGVNYNVVSGPPDQYILTRLTTLNGDTFYANGLANGTTTCAGTAPGSIGLMDDLNINNLATGFVTANLPIRTVLFGGINFTNANGDLPDFFIFEGAGTGSGNPDDITVAAIFPDDSLGVAVAAPTTIASPIGGQHWRNNWA